MPKPKDPDRTTGPEGLLHLACSNTLAGPDYPARSPLLIFLMPMPIYSAVQVNGQHHCLVDVAHPGSPTGSTGLIAAESCCPFRVSMS